MILLAKYVDSFEDFGPSEKIAPIIRFLSKYVDKLGGRESKWVQRAILAGRKIAANVTEWSPQSHKDIRDFLNTQGLLRYDFSEMSWNYGRFYRDIGSGGMITSVDDFETNEEYESYIPIDYANAIMEADAIRECTGGRDPELVAYYGLVRYRKGDTPSWEPARTLEEVGEELATSAKSVSRAVKLSLKLLRNNGHKPPKNFGIAKRSANDTPVSNDAAADLIREIIAYREKKEFKDYKELFKNLETMLNLQDIIKNPNFNDSRSVRKLIDFFNSFEDVLDGLLEDTKFGLDLPFH